MKKLNDYFQTKHVMVFLMGLNESYSQLRTQLLLMEPEPTIQKAFSLVAQDVEQRIFTGTPASNTLNNVAMMVKTSHLVTNRTHGASFKWNEHLLCTHCDLQGHTVDRCYKLHGFPPSYRSQRSSSSKQDFGIYSYINHSFPNQFAGLNTEKC